MLHEWQGREMHAGVYVGNQKGRNHLEDPHGGGSYYNGF
jgi:hypothetical protein